MILLIDNYDSFTYNLFQYFSEYIETKVIRNDEINTKDIHELKPAGIILSPGPKTPYEAGICIDIVKKYYKEIPILGVCLGHQSIAAAFGTKILQAEVIVHGKESKITHTQKGIFNGIPQNTIVGRYHSLIIDPDTLPSELRVTATAENGEIMGIEHEKFPVYGVQFHPESIMTQHGFKYIENFLERSGLKC